MVESLLSGMGDKTTKSTAVIGLKSELCDSQLLLIFNRLIFFFCLVISLKAASFHI